MTARTAALLFLAGLLLQPLHALPRASTPEEQSEFLAGVELPKNSVLHALQKSPEYRRHQQKLQGEWAFCRQVRYDAMQVWGRTHLAPYPASKGILRYLFGGPDFLNAYAFFPQARVMVLGGLEPVGDVPPPEALDPAGLGAALQSLDEALHTSLFCGYFITTEMKPQLVQGSFQGVLPVLYTELALTGNIIRTVQMVHPFGSPGVEIVYQQPGGPQQTLYYFKADLSNGKECRNFLQWLGDLGPGASYLKAASYLLPLEWFSETRNFLLKTSELILQDDSGIPFRAFRPNEWHLQLYGVYTDPLPIFHLQREAELDAAFHSSDYAGPLPFGAGYHVNGNDANLLLAIKNNGQPYLPPASGAITAGVTLAEPTPKPTPIRIRKALPVPIRKAIPVTTPKPKRTPDSRLVVQPLPTPSPFNPANAITFAPNPSSPEPTPEPIAVQPASTPTPAPSATPTATNSPVPLSAPDPTPLSTPLPSSTPTPAPLNAPVTSSEPFAPLPEPMEAPHTEMPQPLPVPSPEASPLAIPTASTATTPQSIPVEPAPSAIPVTSGGKPID
jgi:hypothetical protein